MGEYSWEGENRRIGQFMMLFEWKSGKTRNEERLIAGGELRRLSSNDPQRYSP